MQHRYPRLNAFRQALGHRVDGASLRVFRIGFGLIASIAAIRFVAMGWVETLLAAPQFHFTWVDGLPIPTASMFYALFALQVIAGLAIAANVATRLSLLVWLAAFGYVELVDKSLYLNHYVLMTLVGVALAVAPVQQATQANGTVSQGALWMLRLLFGLVYFWAGVAKLNGDWLFRAEPLSTWLGAMWEVPAIGSWLAQPWTAFVLSWAGAIYDLSVPLLLLWRPTRRYAFVAVVGFHAAVGALFNIGVFPWFMVLGATLFFSPTWPRRDAPVASGRPARGYNHLQAVAWVAACVVLVVTPARFLWSGPDVNWTERGYRFAWRVLLNEKTGLVDYRVFEPSTGKRWRALPSAVLTPMQHQQMRTQPDMIRDYALHLKAAHTSAGRHVQVFVDAFASLNGRPTQRLIRPDIDITADLDVLERTQWIVPLQRDE